METDDTMERDKMHREPYDLQRAAFGEPPHPVTVTAIRRWMVRRRAMEAVAAVISAAVPALGGTFGGHAPRAGLAHPVIAYVVNPGPGTVTPIRTATNTPLPPIKVRGNATSIAITP